MRISVIICTKDRPADLHAALCSLAGQTRQPDEVLIVDAGAEHPLDPSLHASLPLTHLRTTPGLTAQRNLGIRHATGDLLIFFDDDVVLEPAYLAHIEAVFLADQDGRIGAAGGRVTDAIQPETGLGGRARRLVRTLFGLTDMGDGRLKASGFPAHPFGQETAREISCLSGCNMALRREVFDRARFDEAFSGYSYMEDVDMAMQVRRQGYAIQYEPAARLEHHASPQARDAGERVMRMLVRNYAYLFRKHWDTGPWRRLVFRWALCGLIVQQLMARDRHKLRGLLAGLRDEWHGEGLQPAGLRLLYLTEHLPTGSGETFFIPEIDALLAAGHAVHIVPVMDRGPSRHPDARRLLGHTTRIPLRSPAFALGVLGEMLRHPRTAWRLLRHPDRPEQRGGNLRSTLKSLYVAGLARRWGVRHIHAQWADYPATLAQAVSALTDIPWSLTLHRYDIVADNRLAEKLRDATFARFISESGLRLAEAIAGPEALARAGVLHVGVTIPAAPAPEATVPRLVCPANLVPVKGHAVLLEAVARLRERGIDAELDLAGDGELRETLAAQIVKLHLDDRVHLRGVVPHDALLAAYAAGAVMAVVLPSLDLGHGLHEGIPAALMEAMSYGIPVISTTTGGIPELCGEDAGLLVPPGDAEALADALARVLCDAALRRRLGANGRARVCESFNATRIAAELAAACAQHTRR